MSPLEFKKENILIITLTSSLRPRHVENLANMGGPVEALPRVEVSLQVRSFSPDLVRIPLAVEVEVAWAFGAVEGLHDPLQNLNEMHVHFNRFSQQVLQVRVPCVRVSEVPHEVTGRFDHYSSKSTNFSALRLSWKT